MAVVPATFSAMPEVSAPTKVTVPAYESESAGAAHGARTSPSVRIAGSARTIIDGARSGAVPRSAHRARPSASALPCRSVRYSKKYSSWSNVCSMCSSSARCVTALVAHRLEVGDHVLDGPVRAEEDPEVERVPVHLEPDALQPVPQALESGLA